MAANELAYNSLFLWKRRNFEMFPVHLQNQLTFFLAAVLSKLLIPSSWFIYLSSKQSGFSILFLVVGTSVVVRLESVLAIFTVSHSLETKTGLLCYKSLSIRHGCSQTHLWYISSSVSEISQRGVICKSLRRLSWDVLRTPPQKCRWDLSCLCLSLNIFPNQYRK